MEKSSCTERGGENTHKNNYLFNKIQELVLQPSQWQTGIEMCKKRKIWEVRKMSNSGFKNSI